MDSRLVEAALAELELLTRGGLVAGTVAGDAQGLQPPVLTVRLESRDHAATLGFGAQADPRRSFVSVDGRVYLVPRRAHELWPQDARGLLDRRAFEVAPHATTRLAVAGVVLTQEPQRWRVTPPDGRADTGAVRELLAFLASVPSAPAVNGVPLSLEVVDDTGSRRLASVVSPHDGERLRALLARLLSAHPTELRAAELEQIELSVGPTQLLLRRQDDDTFALGERGTLEAERGLVSALVGAVHRLVAEGVPAAQVAPFQPTGATLAFRGGGLETALEVGQRIGARRTFRVRGDAAVYLADDGAWATPSVGALAWRRRVLWSLPPASVEALALGTAELRRDERFRWVRSDAPAAPPPDPAALAELLRAVASFPVVRFLPAASLAPAPGALTLRVETIDGTVRTTHSALVLEETAEGPRVRSGELGAVLDGEVWKRLRALLGSAAR